MRKNVLLLSVLLPIACGCASQSPLVCASLPASPKPQVPSPLMQPEPARKSSYQKQLSEVFETSQRARTAKPSGSGQK